jgi:tripeptidyl-peptidase-1
VSSNSGNSLGSQAVFESLGQYYSPSDLAQFQKNYNLPSDNVDNVVGGYESDSACVSNPNNCVEANLDVQYMMALSQLTPTTYWYDGALDCFVDWILAVAADPNPPLVNSISYGSIETSLPSIIAKQFNTEAMKLGVQGVCSQCSIALEALEDDNLSPF